LGQSSNGALIRSTYGDPVDAVGGNAHDWLPKQGEPSWHLLTASAVADNIVAMNP
jgi:hypothetical protein